MCIRDRVYANPTELGGYKEISVSISGDGAYSRLKLSLIHICLRKGAARRDNVTDASDHRCGGLGDHEMCIRDSYYFKPGEYYTVPYRCLCPKGSKNLLVAGRCISSTHEAQASYRIMPICCCLGEVAGVAAALCSKSDSTVSQIDMPAYQRYLKEHGLIL